MSCEGYITQDACSALVQLAVNETTVQVTDAAAEAIMRIEAQTAAVVFLLGFGVMGVVMGLLLWISAVIRVQTKRNIFMVMASLMGLGYASTTSVIYLNVQYRGVVAYEFLWWFIILSGMFLVDATISRAVVIIPNPTYRFRFEVTGYTVVLIYTLASLGLATHDATQKQKEFPHWNVEIIYLLFVHPLGCIVFNCIFLVYGFKISFKKHIRNDESWCMNRIASVFTSTMAFGLCTAASYSMIFFCTFHFNGTPWISASVTFLCSAILIGEYLMDFFPFFYAFIRRENDIHRVQQQQQQHTPRSSPSPSPAHRPALMVKKNSGTCSGTCSSCCSRSGSQHKLAMGGAETPQEQDTQDTHDTQDTRETGRSRHPSYSSSATVVDIN